MEMPDPLEQAEGLLKQAHQKTRRQFGPAYRKYPILLLLLITISLASVFHGLDLFMDQFSFLSSYPLVLTLVGIAGLFVTGNLYKALGKDKYE